ncbi:uncharacterized protein [Chironomus tepperi]|uniref:uncharacterized protein n=1 Tax=Chironomus tepperi TaxID=113505 RepID=UPI00391F9019
MKSIFLIIAVISAIAFSYPAPEDSYEYEELGSDGFDYSLFDSKTNDESYWEKMKNSIKNMKNSKFYHRCIKFNSTIEDEFSDDTEPNMLNNQTIVMKEPTNEQKENCWKYLKNKGSKAKNWFTSWFSTTKVEPESYDDVTEQKESKNETITTFSPYAEDSKIYYPGFEDMLTTQKSPGIFGTIFG